MKKKFFSVQESIILILGVLVPLSLYFLNGILYPVVDKYFPYLNFNKQGLELIGKYYFIMFLVFMIAIACNSYVILRNRFVLKKAQKDEAPEFDTAIIIANHEDFSLKNMILSSYSYYYKYFFELMRLKKAKFKVFENININTFDELIKNPKIKSYYLFGHGSRHAFELFEKSPIYYCRYENLSLDKEFVAQYHCNHGFGKSLADYVIKDKDKLKKCDITQEQRNPKDLKKQWKEEIKELKRQLKHFSSKK